MKLFSTLLVGALCLLPAMAIAQDKPAAISDAIVQTYSDATFGKASPDWQARMQQDETIQKCNKFRNNIPAAEADAIQNRERARVVLPADGKFTGNWKAGFQIANNGQGGQFSDPPGTIAGGNCYACHQLDPLEVSYGTLGPSLTGYGRDRGFKPEEAKNAFIKIYDSQAVQACSNMPRFGANKVLNEQQIRDAVAYLFDPESPVNK